MKERLTKRDKDGNAVAFNYIKTAGEFKEVADSLAEYEDLEEQGLIVKSPCKAGDTLYLISCNEIIELTVYRIDISIKLNKESKQEIIGSIYATYTLNSFYDMLKYTFDVIDKTLFTTREKAEKKLAELKGENR